jgi:hypothetical protein
MDEPTFKARVARLEEVNAVIAKVEEAIRAEAFDLLKPYISGDAVEGEPDVSNTDGNGGSGSNGGSGRRRRSGGAFDAEALVDDHESDNEADNVYLCLAIFYARHGRGPFTMPQLKTIAQEFGLAIPGRHDNTIRDAKRDGKAVVRKGADGWKITPGGETWLKETYKVTRGHGPLTP